MWLSKTFVVLLLASGIGAAFAQSGDSITLDEYARILAAKMKQPEKVDSPMAVASAPASTTTKREKVNPFAGWTYNGATMDLATSQPLFGELIVNGRSRIVYPGDVVAPSWRVAVLTERAIELQNSACATPAVTGGTPKTKGKALSGTEQFCQFRLPRKV